MSQTHEAEPQGQDDHHVTQFRNACMFLFVGLGLDAEMVNGAGVSPGTAIYLVGVSGGQQQDRHPGICDENVDGDPGGEYVVTNFENLEHGGLVCAAADPASSQCGHAAPHRVRPFHAEQIRHKGTCDQQGNRPTNDDADGACEEHDQGAGTKLQCGRQIGRHGEQDECRREQET